MNHYGERTKFNSREEALLFLTSNFLISQSGLENVYVKQLEPMEEVTHEHCSPDYQIKPFEGKFVIHRQTYYKQDALMLKRRRTGIVTFYNVTANSIKARFVKSEFLSLNDLTSTLMEKAIYGMWLMDYEHDVLNGLYDIYRRRFLMKEHRRKTKEALRTFCIENGISLKAIEIN